MEVIFENCYYSNKVMAQEYLKDITYKPQRIFAFVFSIICAASIILSIYIGDTFSIILFCALFVVFLCYSFLYILIAKQLMNETLKLHNGTMPESIVSFGDRIEFAEGLMKAEYEYSQVIKVYNLKTIYVLMISKRSGIILQKDGFTAGKFDNFKAFIKDKCKNVKFN